ncbi:ribbon-helix-helix protein, CopG family [Streptomyces spiramenti]|uniref:Ribbon-helix-helix protein, CopG family n=1 Tax=Streptomyces spiramenti TaxID=2720606 RepID=A0ABX1ATK0_9ACTN|nr:ribbon-helix-helix protein, CopG family [Streptomyces spiramenti]NJP67580.1 ribbon-helix-helix protein, CopG family [Streptomyces spiramenti]
MTSRVLSLRLDGELTDRLTGHAARRGMTLQEYVAGVLVREDFDERFRDAVERTERFDGRGEVGQDV